MRRTRFCPFRVCVQLCFVRRKPCAVVVTGCDATNARAINACRARQCHHTVGKLESNVVWCRSSTRLRQLPKGAVLDVDVQPAADDQQRSAATKSLLSSPGQARPAPQLRVSGARPASVQQRPKSTSNSGTERRQLDIEAAVSSWLQSDGGQPTASTTEDAKRRSRSDVKPRGSPKVNHGAPSSQANEAPVGKRSSRTGRKTSSSGLSPRSNRESPGTRV